MSMPNSYNKLIESALWHLAKREMPLYGNLPLPKKPKAEKAPPKVALAPPPKPKVEKPKPELKPAPQPIVEKPMSLQPPSPPKPEASSSLKSLMQKVVPNLPIIDEIPSDFQAKRIKNAWQEQFSAPEVPILTSGKKHLEFLQNIARAIDHEIVSSRVVDVAHLEKEKKWDLFLDAPNLKLILAPDALIWGHQELMKFYTEVPSQKTRTLGKTPLLLLPDLSFYLKEPSLKRSLWQLIKRSLQSS